MSGHIRRSGKASWELKFNAAGKTHYRSFKGTKREAIAEMTKLTASALTGSYVDANKITVAEFLDRWLRGWAESNVSAKTIDRYAQIVKYIDPHLGPLQLQKLKPIALNEFYAELLRAGGHNGKKAVAAIGGQRAPAAARCSQACGEMGAHPEEPRR
ncbi:MAG: N-terminal phage integrase SAM-like domain-containing protein [Xanthobacteraceae bacterium]